jgi:TonB family protein
LAALSVAAFARPEVSNSLEKLSAVKVSDLSAYLKQNAEKSVQSSSVVMPVAGVENAVTSMIGSPQKGHGQPLKMAEKMPAFPGGTPALLKFINKSLKYPQEALKNKEHGTAVVQFVVSKTGSVESVKIVRSVSRSIDKEAVRVVSNMPKWIPGEEKGKKVAVLYTMPINFVPRDSGSKTEKDSKLTSEDNSELKVYDMVEEMPKYPEGQTALMNFLASNIKYPEEASKNKVSGKVIVQFVVDKEGYVKDPNIVRSISDALDKEAIRVVNSMPKWTPGKENGEAVNVRYTLPITFALK